MAVEGVLGPTLCSGPRHTLVPFSNDLFICVRKWDKAVLSVQPDGRQEYRPAGSTGPFEQCTLLDGKIRYAYTWGDPTNPNPQYQQQVEYVHVVAWETLA